LEIRDRKQEEDRDNFIPEASQFVGLTLTNVIKDITPSNMGKIRRTERVIQMDETGNAYKSLVGN
jgi:hypothetical protein